MATFEWHEQVQVQTLVPVEKKKDHQIEGGIIKWDGIDFAEAVSRSGKLPNHERANIVIFAPSGVYTGAQIEELVRRSDRPK